MPQGPVISHADLLEILSYNKSDGQFRWKKKISSKVIVGRVAGGRGANGYLYIQVKGRVYTQHRLAWFYVTGEWPHRVDHKNNIRSDNRWENLREATRAQNAMNSKRPSHNTSGFKGAYRRGGKWLASIKIDGRSKHIGLFDTREEAHAAYISEAKKREPEFARAE